MDLTQFRDQSLRQEGGSVFCLGLTAMWLDVIFVKKLSESQPFQKMVVGGGGSVSNI